MTKQKTKPSITRSRTVCIDFNVTALERLWDRRTPLGDEELIFIIENALDSGSPEFSACYVIRINEELTH
jgi:hypothetical protein